jgi:diaminopimelate decarboxylase
MTEFNYHGDTLFAEDISLNAIAEQYGTPCYIYSRAAIETAFTAYLDALKGCEHLVCYAVKANSNLAILNLLSRLGAGFDIVSGGELQRVIAAGGDPRKVVFSGVAKSPADMASALEQDILCFNLESAAELEVLNEVARAMDTTARISGRVNPDVDAQTHPYISTGLRDNKFGVDMDTALAIYRRAAELDAIEITGIDCHIGSQLTQISPFIDALQRLLNIVDQLASEGIAIRHMDVGGGLGVRYQDETPPPIADYVSAIRAEIADRELTLMFEPGRSIVANAGMLLTRVDYLKTNADNNFAIVDAAMNDMIRPALYQAWLDILPVTNHVDVPSQQYDIVGPVCESADFLGKGRQLAIRQGDHLAVMGAGAYGFVMSSNYNTRPRAAEVMVDGKNSQLVRAREQVTDLFAGEQLLPE